MNATPSAPSSNPHFQRVHEILAAWEAAPRSRPAIANIFECHIFCSPLDPDEATREAFARSCEEAGLKPLCLGLDYQDRGVVDVLQSTKYYECADPAEPLRHMLRDAAALEASGFEVTRLKLEAMADNPGVPRRDEDAEALPGDTYFEFHIKVGGREVSAANDALLMDLGRELTEELGVKVPFSCNNMKGKDQRFLNLRTYGLGSQAADRLVDEVVRRAEAKGFQVSKVIREFIVFDTNKELDRGWLEF